MKRAVLLLVLAGALGSVASSRGGTAVSPGHGVLYLGARGMVIWSPGQSPRHLGPVNGDEETPQWSPDGRSIAFVANSADSANSAGYDVYVMRADGANVRRVTSDGEGKTCNCVSAIGPSWSPDGHRIVFVHEGYRRSRLVVLNLYTGRRRTVPGDVAWNVAPAWGGAGIAFVGGSKIIVLDLASGHRREFPTSSYPATLAWSKAGDLAAIEGRGIVFYGPSGRIVGHMTIPRGANRACGLAWSPDATQVVVRMSGRGRLWSATVANGSWQRLPVSVETPAAGGYCGVSWR